MHLDRVWTTDHLRRVADPGLRFDPAAGFPVVEKSPWLASAITYHMGSTHFAAVRDPDHAVMRSAFWQAGNPYHARA